MLNLFMMESKSDSLYDIWLELVKEEKEEEEKLERERKEKEKEMGNTMSEEETVLSTEVLDEGTVNVNVDPPVEEVQKKRKNERKLRSHLNFMIDCGGLPLKLVDKVDPEIFEEFWSLQNDHLIKFGITTDYGHCSRIGKWVRLNEQFLFSDDGRHIVYHYHWY